MISQGYACEGREPKSLRRRHLLPTRDAEADEAPSGGICGGVHTHLLKLGGFFENGFDHAADLTPSFGKAMWAVFAQSVALPSAGIGLISAICFRLFARGKEEPESLRFSLIFNAAGLIPVSVIYLKLRYG
jgi:hypothetical protein